jgi:hypothetical protein
MAYLEIFEETLSGRKLRPAAIQGGTSRRDAVVRWAQALSDADHAPFEIEFVQRMRGHELYEVRVGSRTFQVIAKND